MVLLNTATKVYKGTSLVTKVYKGTTQVWPPAGPTYGSDEYVTVSPLPTAVSTGGGAMCGMKYRFAVSGVVRGLRIIPTVTSLTVPEIYLFTGTGTLLASKDNAVTLTANTWNTILFDTPIPVFSGLTYVAALWGAPLNLASADGTYAGQTSGNVTALADGVDGQTATFAATRDLCPLTDMGNASMGISPIFATVTSGTPTAAIVGSTFVNQTSASSTSIASTLPAGVANGDRLYAVFMSTAGSSGSTVTPSITGWTVASALADVGTAQRAMYTATYSAGLAAPSWSMSAGAKQACMVIAVRNANATPVVSFADAGGLTSTAPSNASAPVGLGLRLYIRKDSLSTTCTPGAGMTELFKSLGVATGPSCHVVAYVTSQAAAGASGTAVTTWNVTSINSTAWTISL
jgi:hypothetical protein